MFTLINMRNYFKTPLFSILLTIIFSCHISAEIKYHGPALYGIRGYASEIKVKSKSQLQKQDKVKFDKEGKIINSLMTYNADGYPFGFSVTHGNSFVDCKVEWNENDTFKSFKYVSTIWPGKGSCNIDLYYDGDNYLPIKVISFSENEDKTKTKTVICEYSDYELDEKGNWISRNVSETVKEVKLKKNGKEEEKEKSSSFTETRTIVY